MTQSGEAPFSETGEAVAEKAIGHAGYAQHFERTLGRFASFAVAFSFISITTGLFNTYGFALATGGPAGIWTWPIASFGILLVALVYGMLANRMPLSGYSYQWVSRLASPLLGWWFGWVSFAFLAIAVVSVDYGLAQVAFFPLFDIDFTPERATLAAALFAALQMTLVIWSTKITTVLNNLAVGAELIAMAGLTLLVGGAALFAGHGDIGNLSSFGAVPSDGYFGWLGPFMLSALLGCYTLVGWESAANLAEETHNPKSVVPLSMVRAVVLSGGLGMLFLMAITWAIDDVDAATASSAPVAYVVEQSLGHVAETMLLAVVTVAMFACALVVMVTNSRLIYSMARDDRLPASKLLSNVPRPTGGPLGASLLAGLVSIGIVVGFGGSPDALAELLGSAALLPALLYFGTVVVYLATRNSHTPHPDDFSLGRWHWPVVVGALVWLVIELALLGLPEEFRAAQRYVLGTLALGALVFAFVMVTRGHSMRTEPGVPVDDL